jgi:hypothetical protein
MNTKAIVKKAIADGQAFQQKYGRSPSIIVRRHHDHLSAVFGNREANASNWPMCLTCNHIVEGYGIENENATHFEVMAECHGEKTSLRVDKRSRGPATEDWKAEVLKYLTFFPKRESDK